MKNRLKSYHKKNIIKLEKNPYDPHSQDVTLCCKMPVISKVNSKDLNIVNNETFTIQKIKEDMIYMSNNNKKLEIHKDDFQNIFYLAYCITIHSDQGETVDEDYTIFDWELLDEKLQYVDLTRATYMKYINIF